MVSDDYVVRIMQTNKMQSIIISFLEYFMTKSGENFY